MLSEKTIKLVKSTVPVLEQRGVDVTKNMYSHMLGENPDLLNIFNRTNQATGLQPKALAATVLAAAKNIDNLGVLLPAVRQIGFKHRALQVKPEQYGTVGKYLLASIKETLNPPEEVLEAWKESYGVIAKTFIDVEAEMYKTELWNGWKTFVISGKKKVNESGTMVEFSVDPVDESLKGALTKFVPGQYITVRTKPDNNDGHYALRHYSMSEIQGPDSLRFSVKFDDGKQGHQGLVSHYLIEKVNVGDKIELSAPAGDFELDKSLLNNKEVPLVLLSAGSGASPLLALLQEQLSEGSTERPIYWIQSNRLAADVPFVHDVDAELKQHASNYKNLQVITERSARIDKQFLESNIPAEKSDIYLCGSVSFMDAMLKHLKEISKHYNLHYEAFGPKMSTV